MKSWYGTIDELIENYDNVNSEIITPYIRQDKDYYNETAYPDFFTNRVLGLICEEINGVLTVDCIIKQLDILLRLNRFEKATIEILFSNIVSNIRQKTAINFADNGNSEKVDELIEILDKCCDIDVNLSEFLRFLIMNQLYCVNNDTLFIKKMIYRRYGEIIISEYISREFDNSASSASFDKFIKGLYRADMINHEHKLDMYYLRYEKENNHYNFMCIQ